MLPGRYDPPVIWRGCDWPTITLIWKDANGNPFNLTGWTPYAALITGDTLNPLVTDALNGVTTLGLARDATSLLDLGRISWDWIWWNGPPDGSPKGTPSLNGFVEIRDPSTHSFPLPPPSPQ